MNVFIFLSCVSLHAQMSYYLKGEKIPLTVDRNFVNVIADEDFLKSSSSSQLFQSFNLERDERTPVQGIVKLKLKSAPEIKEYSEIVEMLQKNENIKQVFPFFEREGAEPIGTSDIFYLKLKEEKDSVLMKKLADEHRIEILSTFMPTWYILSIKYSNFSNSIDVTNYFWETGLFDEVDPAFMFHFKPHCVNEPMQYFQWGLHNIPGINANEAWKLIGNEEISVAVVDTKIQADHPDLSANIRNDANAHYIIQ